MIEIAEGKLIFKFHKNITAAKKYDELSFYRNQFNHNFNGTKAVDILCIGNQKGWLIEVKDYRIHRRTKLIDLSEEVAFKVRDTLAGLVAMKCNANDVEERKFAKDFLKKDRLAVVLHLEQPKRNSKLFPEVANPANVKQKLKMLLKAIDAHPMVIDITKSNEHQSELDWIVK